MIGWRSAIAGLLLAWQGPAVRDTAQQPELVLSVDVNLVLLHASVHDRKGRDVPNLTQNDFRLYEDGAAQEIRVFRHEDAPVTLGLIVDHSGSMAPKLGDVTAAARMLAQSSNPEDELFVVNFNERVFPSRLVTATEKGAVAVEAAIAGVPAEGTTALYDAVAYGLDMLGKGHWARKVLVVISDGGDNASRHKLAEVIRLAEESSAVIYTVGIYDPGDSDADPLVLRRLARETGGEAFFPKKTADTGGICEHIAGDIRTQYMIGYVPGNAKSAGVFHSIRLEAETRGSGKLHVRTRKGYITAANAR